MNKRRQRGLSVLTAIFLITTLALLSAGAVRMVSTAGESRGQEVQSLQARAAARMGLERAFYVATSSSCVPVGAPNPANLENQAGAPFPSTLANFVVTVTCTPEGTYMSGGAGGGGSGSGGGNGSSGGGNGNSNGGGNGNSNGNGNGNGNSNGNGSGNGNSNGNGNSSGGGGGQVSYAHYRFQAVACNRPLAAAGNAPRCPNNAASYQERYVEAVLSGSCLITTSSKQCR